MDPVILVLIGTSFILAGVFEYGYSYVESPNAS